MVYFLSKNAVLNVAQQRQNKVFAFNSFKWSCQCLIPRPHSQTRNQDFVTWPELVPCFSPPMLHRLAGVGDAASGTWNSDSSLHPRHEGVQEGLLLLLLLILPAVLSSEVDRWSASDPQLPASSGPAPPRTAGTLCGETLLRIPPMSPLFLKSWQLNLKSIPLGETQSGAKQPQK